MFDRTQTTWRRYRQDPVGFVRAFLRWTPLTEEHADRLSDLGRSPLRMGITSPTFDFWTFSAAVAYWKAFCWRASSTLVVVPRPSVGATWVMHAEQVAARSVLSIRQELLIAKNKSSIGMKQSEGNWAITHMEPQALDTGRCRALAGGPLTLILPSFSAIPTPYITDACKMLLKGDLLLVDEPPVC